MKMERIGDNQIKVILNKNDLLERDIKLTELAYGGDKARELFREIMEIAFDEHDFDVDNVPIMVEAMPLSMEAISIIVTKVTEEIDLEKRLKKLPTYLEENFLNSKATSKKTIKNPKLDNIIIFSFDNIDAISDVSKRIETKFNGISILYKENFKYYLLMEIKKDSSIQNQQKLENILAEYGEKHISNETAKFYLKEHGEILVKKDAIQVLAKI